MVWSSAFTRSVVGGIAYGLVVAAISHPFDTLKIMRQASAGRTTGRPAGESLQSGLATRQLLTAGSPVVQPWPGRASTLAQLYRGVGPSTCAAVLLRTVPFVGYETVRGYCLRNGLLTRSPVLLAFIGVQHLEKIAGFQERGQ
mmetsp:Transcript_59072/g.135464  ORF Transcript_59072/g.135464 Transcript_59072/m.135464 type:complete len:143 (-) Transcript_59072:708-1136(-)